MDVSCFNIIVVWFFEFVVKSISCLDSYVVGLVEFFDNFIFVIFISYICGVVVVFFKYGFFCFWG